MKHTYREKQRQAKRRLAGPKSYVLLSYALYLPVHHTWLCALCELKEKTVPATWVQHTLGFGQTLEQTHKMFSNR